MSPGQPVRTTCPYCGVGCGVLATPQADGSVTIAGDPEHPANFGRLCSKGSAVGETLSLDGRLLHPEIDGHRVTWDAALDRVAAVFSQTIAEYGPDSVAFYGSGQLLTEDYYVANKLMKGFLGSANIDTNSRLCMASSVAGHKRAFGSDTVPGNYEDLERADLIVLVGSNLAWCHPVLYQRILKAKAERPQMRIVLIDPRRTSTADQADLHLAIAPDGDSALFVGLLRWLAEKALLDREFLSNSTSEFSAALAVARRWSLDAVSQATGLSARDIAVFYDWFGATPRTVTVFSQGVNQSAGGTDKVNAIINCHLATGRIGLPGMGPFSVTGQPNAMGGREVGGLSNMLAAHMDFEPENVERLRRFWQSAAVATRPGLKAVDLFDAVVDGRIKALWIMATNPVDSMPEADKVRAALRACPFVVVSDMMSTTDTVAEANVRLPAAGWGEKDGTVTNSERRISRQRPMLPLPGEARPDWWIISAVARRMGFGPAFPYSNAAEIFAEHVALSAFENGGRRDFNLEGLEDTPYDELMPTQWPVRDGGTSRMFTDGVFYTPDRRARFIAVEPMRPEPLADMLTLNTGRVRDHWHTMTRTGKAPRLSAHLAEPFVEISPDDAFDRGITDAGLVELANEHGCVHVRALITERQRSGSVFAPMHWTDQFSSNGRIDKLVTAAKDPVSGQPALKMAAITARPAKVAFYGFAVSIERPNYRDADYWAMAAAVGGWRTELAFVADSFNPLAWARQAFGVEDNAELVSFVDHHTGRHNLALFDAGRLVFALFVSPAPVAVSRQWAAALLGQPVDATRRVDILAGRPGADRPDIGPLVCACNNIGANQIVAAARAGSSTVEAIGSVLRAGTTCGSCRPEIRALLAKLSAGLA
ncbi:molybdopterin-dependent oxidoreductase [Devosia sp.]|uniref:nitrate reductase n=1 Tax=Devosia sp. TaxID=1871048 RepID=UPI003BAD8793